MNHPLPVTHVTLPDSDDAACNAASTHVVPWAEAMAPGGRHFDCPDCQKVLTGGQRHAEPPS